MSAAEGALQSGLGLRTGLLKPWALMIALWFGRGELGDGVQGRDGKL